MNLTLDEALHLVLSLVWVGVVFGAVASLAGLLTWVERKMSAVMQDRIGPNRANIRLGRNWRLFGLFHPIADATKMLFKEDFIPAGANRILHTLAPIISLTVPFTVFAVIPFAGPLTIHWKDIPAEQIPGLGAYFPGDVLHLSDFVVSFQVADLNVGILFIFAISSLAIYGTMLAGWSSNNKFSFLGALRAASQMISYEVGLGLAVVGIIMVYGAVSVSTIVERQGQLWLGIIPKWGVITQPLGFLLFLACGMAEIKRVPFDLPEGESEIVAGYFTEYSSAKFLMFMFGEFIEWIVLGTVITTLFFGGWQIPYLSSQGIEIPLLKVKLLFQDLAFVQNTPGAYQLVQVLVVTLQAIAFAVKVLFFVWLIGMIRWTFPRFRYDQVMKMGWKMILPLALLNIMGTGVYLLVEWNLKPTLQSLLGY